MRTTLVAEADSVIMARSHTQLDGIWRVIGRAVWATILAVNGCFFVVGLMARLSVILSHTGGSLDYSVGLSPVSLPPDTLLIYRSVLDILLVLGFWLVAVAIFWRRSNDWLAIFVSAMFVMLGFIMSTLPTALERAAPQAAATINFDQLLGLHNN